MEVKRLVEEKDVSPEEPDGSHYNRTPLHYASRRGRDTVVAYLLEDRGVDVDKVDRINWTAVFCYL